MNQWRERMADMDKEMGRHLEKREAFSLEFPACLLDPGLVARGVLQKQVLEDNPVCCSLQGVGTTHWVDSYAC